MIIEFNKISCGYKDHVLVSDLSFSLETGRAVCILGANGIGKTTFFKTILGQISLLDGDILVDGESVNKLSTKSRAQIFSYVPQARRYSYQFTAREIILMGRASYIRKFSMPSDEDYRIVEEVICQLDIRNLADRNYNELSGGEQQIIVLARAIAQGAKFILLDEPASNLDFKNQSKLLRIINALTEKGVGILMVSHSPEHAFMCCDYTLLLSKDQKYLYGRSEDVVTTENLSSIYGVPIKVLEHRDSSGKIRYSCCLESGESI